jgi:hypothetical protein
LHPEKKVRLPPLARLAGSDRFFPGLRQAAWRYAGASQRWRRRSRGDGGGGSYLDDGGSIDYPPDEPCCPEGGDPGGSGYDPVTRAAATRAATRGTMGTTATTEATMRTITMTPGTMSSESRSAFPRRGPPAGAPAPLPRRRRPRAGSGRCRAGLPARADLPRDRARCARPRRSSGSRSKRTRLAPRATTAWGRAREGPPASARARRRSGARWSSTRRTASHSGTSDWSARSSGTTRGGRGAGGGGGARSRGRGGADEPCERPEATGADRGGPERDRGRPRAPSRFRRRPSRARPDREPVRERGRGARRTREGGGDRPPPHPAP